MRVSVVVPVFDPGRYLQDLIASLTTQTLDPAEFETVFVDDGSTDGSGEVLDRLAAATPNVRVLHLPNSGWPGRPRNVGIDAARGRYVFLADHDDRLASDALERLTGFADEHGSDVVLGRVVGVGRNAPTRVFARTVVDAQQDLPLLFTSLTPQKLFRRAFLQEAEVRFPEGPRRLEDHLFMTRAYLRARRVSVLADRPAYFFVLREDGRNASRRPVAWPGYFADAAESVAVVDAEAPEAARVAVRARWLRTEALGRLRGRRYAERADRAALTAAARAFVGEHYPEAELDLLAPADRLAARLLVSGRDDELLAFARWEAGLRLLSRIDAASVEGGQVRLVLLGRVEATAAEPGVEGFDAVRTALLRVPSGTRVAVRLRERTGRVLEARVEHRVQDGVLCVEALAAVPPGTWRVEAVASGAGGLRAAALGAGSSPVLTSGARIRTDGRGAPVLLVRPSTPAEVSRLALVRVRRLLHRCLPLRARFRP